MSQHLPTLGYGAANVGNLYRELTDEQANAVLTAAWDAGIRYYDTAPHYGLGLSERRLGQFLATKPRDEFVLSTKVGRLLVDNPDRAGQLDLANDFVVPAAKRRVWDFSADGVRRSVEESLQRLGLDRIDLIYLHDPERFDLTVGLRKGIPAAAALRDEGVVRGIGIGSMSTPALAAAVDTGAVDVLMVAGRYTLLEQPANEVLENCVQQQVSVVIASVFNSGILARDVVPADARYEYRPVPDALRVAHGRLAALCHRHGIDVPTAALQFGLRHPAVASVIVGAATAEQITASAVRVSVDIPEAFWRELAELDLQ